MIRRMPLPEARGGEVRSAFMRGPKERLLRFVVDHSRIAPGRASELLAGFVGHPNVELWSTLDGTLPHLQIDWASAREDRLRVHWASGTRRLLTGVWAVSQYRQAAQRAVTHGLLEDEEMAYRELVLAAACADSRMDGLVTNSAFLLGRPQGIRGNPMPPVAAVASLGLFLRLRGDFHLSRDLTLDRGMFYGLAAWELVPQAWRYVTACRSAGQAIGRDSFWMLARAVVQRMERALRARDRLHEQFQVPQSHDTADEALFYLDTLLVQLNGAFDALARVTHLGLGLNGSYRHASWRHPGWRAQLATLAPTLAALMADHTEERDALELVALLRNSVHGEPFIPIGRRVAGQSINLIELPAEDTPPFWQTLAGVAATPPGEYTRSPLLPAGSESRPIPMLRHYFLRWRAASTPLCGRLS